jgi:Sec-independent protein secretion pathway component TatC
MPFYGQSLGFESLAEPPFLTKIGASLKLALFIMTPSILFQLPNFVKSQSR